MRMQGNRRDGGMGVFGRERKGGDNLESNYTDNHLKCEYINVYLPSTPMFTYCKTSLLNRVVHGMVSRLFK